MQRPAGQEMNAHQNVGVQVSPQFPVGVDSGASEVAYVRTTVGGGTGLRRTAGCGMAITANGRSYRANMYAVHAPHLG